MPEYASSTPTTSLSLPLELDRKLEDFVRREGISKSALILQAIEKHFEDVTNAEQALTEFQASGVKAVPLKEVMKHYDIEYLLSAESRQTA